MTWVRCSHLWGKRTWGPRGLAVVGAAAGTEPAPGAARAQAGHYSLSVCKRGGSLYCATWSLEVQYMELGLVCAVSAGPGGRYAEPSPLPSTRASPRARSCLLLAQVSLALMSAGAGGSQLSSAIGLWAWTSPWGSKYELEVPLQSTQSSTAAWAQQHHLLGEPCG